MAYLQRVAIYDFRNISVKEINLNLRNVIEGRNMSGKTNTLNAIHWAFTGTTIDGSNDNRANFPIGLETPTTSVKLDFGDFIFERRCELVDDQPTVSIYIDGDKAPTLKNGEARLHAKLGLSDFILEHPKFNIIRFLLNPLFFDSLAPKDARKLLYDLADVDFQNIKEQQGSRIQEVVDSYLTNDPYTLLDAIDKKKKGIKKNLATCKDARVLFPSVINEADKLEKDLNKQMTELENQSALAEKYALAVSKRMNSYYKKALGLEVCLLEKGVGDDVWKDVCYPILPGSDLPFSVGSYAERTVVGIRFIIEASKKWNLRLLPILVDNMESLDASTKEILLDGLGVQYIGAKVME